MKSDRHSLSRIAKASIAAAVLGITSAFMAPTTDAALVTYDLIATGGNGATVSNGGKSVALDPTVANANVTFKLIATFPNNDSDQSNDALEASFGSIVANFTGGSSITGALSAALTSPYANGSGANAGTASPDGAGNIDVGGDRTYGTATSAGGQLQANAGTFPTGAAGVAGPLVQQFATVTFALSSGLVTGSSAIQYIPHTSSNPGPLGVTQQFKSDSATASNVNGNSALIALGSPVQVSVAPEPGSVVLLGLGGIGALLRRRKQA